MPLMYVCLRRTISLTLSNSNPTHNPNPDHSRRSAVFGCMQCPSWRYSAQCGNRGRSWHRPRRDSCTAEFSIRSLCLCMQVALQIRRPFLPVKRLQCYQSCSIIYLWASSTQYPQPKQCIKTNDQKMAKP